MFDYKLLEALTVVVDSGGFDKAASALFITQSAVSQRIKLLEEQTGQILITRQNPPLPTESGRKLIKHFRQVKLLESQVVDDLISSQEEGFSTIKVGINSDSLATWFLPVMRSFLRENKILLDVQVDDQDETKELLKNGDVAGCISSSSSAVQGCSITPLGAMDYIMVCTKKFQQQYFKKGFSKESLPQVPAIVFNRKDFLHYKFLQMVFGEEDFHMPIQYVPSSEKFLTMIENDLVYGVVPLMQYSESQKKDQLIDLTGMKLSIDLYWHQWNLRSSLLDDLTKSLVEGCRRIFSVDKLNRE